MTATSTVHCVADGADLSTADPMREKASLYSRVGCAVMLLLVVIVC
jgi:hypothetical protein